MFNLELMLQVRQVALNQRERVWMNYFDAAVDEAFKQGHASRGVEASHQLDNLACGTVHCIGGWARELDPQKRNWYGALGMDRREADALFFFPFLANRYDNYDGHIYADLREKIAPLYPGTREYASVVVEAIDRCIERNKDAS